MSAQTAHATTGYQRLTHNAYAYTYAGQRANRKLYRKGSKVRVIGSILLNGKKYNIISANIYIKAANFKKVKSSTSSDLGEGYETSLLRNSYIYNSKGQRIKGMKLRKDHNITYYGQPVKIRGKKYVLIGENQYVRSVNVLLVYDGPISSDKPNKRKNSNTANDSSSNVNNGSSIANNNTANEPSSNNSGSTNTKADNSKKSDADKQSSKPQDNKLTNPSSNKENKPTKIIRPTDADYTNLEDTIVQNSDASTMFATATHRNAYYNAMDKGREYIRFRNRVDSTVSQKDVQNVTNAINTAVKNMKTDYIAERAKFPKVTVKRGLWYWNPEEKQQALNVINELYGSTDAHILNDTDKPTSIDGLTAVATINGSIRTFGMFQFSRPVFD